MKGGQRWDRSRLRREHEPQADQWMWSDGASQLRLLYRCHRHTHTKYRCLSNGSLQQLVNTDFIQNKAEFREFDVAPMQGETNTVSEG